MDTIEILLVDDESPDKSPEICDDFAKLDNRVKVVHKKNGGLGEARNSGLDIASGEYVTFVDSDDYLDYDSLEKLYNFAKLKKLDVCYVSFCYEFKNGKTLCKYEVSAPTLFDGSKAVECFLLDMVGPSPDYSSDVKYSVSVCKAIFRLDLLHKVKCRFLSEKKIASEDFLFQLNLLPNVKKIGLFPICYYHYCENKNSISHCYSEEKCNRIKYSMIEVKRILSNYFLYQDFILHYQRCLFLSLRGILLHDYERTDISFFKKLSVLSLRCSDVVYSELFNNYPYQKLGIMKRILYIGMKRRLSLLIYVIFFIKNILGK